MHLNISSVIVHVLSFEKIYFENIIFDPSTMYESGEQFLSDI